MKKKEACVTNFLETREEYLSELARLKRLEQQLMALLEVKDTASMEEKILQVRSKKHHPALVTIELYNQQGIIFDRASLKMDCATSLQRQRVEHQQKALNRDLFLIEC